MAGRTQIQIDTSAELRQKIRIVALQRGMTLREFVLRTIADANPDLAEAIESELQKSSGD